MSRDVADGIDELIEDVLVDAYGVYEQLSSFWQWFEDEARFPFRGRVVGVDVDVDVVGVDFDGDERSGLRAVCRRAGERHTVSLTDVTPTAPMSLPTRRLLDAYRRWSGAPELNPTPAMAEVRWGYQRLTSVDVDFAEPLALYQRGDWDPAEGCSRDPGDPRLWRDVMAAGVTPCFEMEQVLPGVEIDDVDDPVVQAADLHRAGYDREARGLLENLLADDVRCIDAWAHLGLIAFDSGRPGVAAELYERGVAVAERSLPEGFGGVLPWGCVDNRPFLRALHGLALCRWRQRRWTDAEVLFAAEVWLDPTQPDHALACLKSVHARQRWTRR